MDPGKIVSVKLSMDKIRDEAERFREEHIFTTELPVDIEHVVEATLGIRIIPIESLQRLCDMEGFISKDFKAIYVDEFLYTDDRYYKRVRFTIAHEIGHYVLHRSTIDSQKFANEGEWIKFRLAIDDDTLGWFETQASEFAGRLLVPLDTLVEEFKSKRQNVLKKYSSWNSPKINEDDLFSMIAPLICGRFDVSAEVIERRMRKENIMSLIGK
ncbi:MAG: ImmA/IrrE family metallo-endopeptidase [Bacteroidales bacterium]|nr:ImmA/IrrE family metallo-endopeptidase [Bacteroidales bacterium]